MNPSQSNTNDVIAITLPQQGNVLKDEDSPYGLHNTLKGVNVEEMNNNSADRCCAFGHHCH